MTRGFGRFMRAAFGFLFHFRFEGLERRVPELVEPASERAEALGVDVVHATRAFGLVRDQAGFFEDFEVLGDGGTADRHFGGDFADSTGAASQVFENLATGWIGQG
jgi:hypothetical protein